MTRHPETGAEAKTVPEFKIVFVGDASVGKTSVILRFHRDLFEHDQCPTIGSAFISKRIETQYGPANVNIWDTAGQERYRSLVPMYSRGAAVVVVVFDISQRETFDILETWIEKIAGDLPNGKILVCANKCDLEYQVPTEEVKVREKQCYTAAPAIFRKWYYWVIRWEIAGTDFQRFRSLFPFTRPDPMH